MSTYLNLDGALTEIARASFYEEKTIVPTRGENGEPAYTVNDDISGHDETVYWTYADGMELDGRRVIDYSRVHEPGEYYDTAAHIRYNLADAITALEEGTPVNFQYVVCDDINAEEDEDPTVGWALIAHPA